MSEALNLSNQPTSEASHNVTSSPVSASGPMPLETLDGRSVLAGYREVRGEQVVRLKRPSLRYLDAFVTATCGPDLLALGLFPNAKEITESWAAFAAVRRYLGGDYPFDDPNLTVVCVGDGTTPRTAAMFAFRTAWRCYSVDPLLRADPRWGRIQRLTVLPIRIEAMRVVPPAAALLVAVHSHADLTAARAAIQAERVAVIALPCCVPQIVGLGVPPDVVYEDWGIWSPERTVKIWRQT